MPAQKEAKSLYRQNIDERIPEYDKLQPLDLRSVTLSDLRVIQGNAAFEKNYDEFIPQSFIDAYGKTNARGEFAHDVVRESARRGTPALAARSFLNGVYSEAAKLGSGQYLNFDQKFEYPQRLPSGEVVTTYLGVDEAFNNYIVAQVAAVSNGAQQAGKPVPNTTTVSIPLDIARNLSAANSKYLPAEIVNKIGYDIHADDELVFFATYAETYRKIKEAGGQVPTRNINEVQTRKVLADNTHAIFNPEAKDLPLNVASATAGLLAELDAKNNFAGTESINGESFPTPSTPARSTAARDQKGIPTPR